MRQQNGGSLDEGVHAEGMRGHGEVAGLVAIFNPMEISVGDAPWP
jgi:hypothetical protein